MEYEESNILCEKCGKKLLTDKSGYYCPDGSRCKSVTRADDTILTKREQFAMAAIQGAATHKVYTKSPKQMAKDALAIADALIEALNQS